jgi:hypothetical protein
VRTISTVTFRTDHEERAAALLAHVRAAGDPLGGDQLRALYDELPKHVKRAQGGDIPGPDHPEVQGLLEEKGFKEGRSDLAQAADALSIMCQATIGELPLDKIIGAFSVPAGHADVNGIVSHGKSGRLVFRLRGSGLSLYSATESLLRTIARMDAGLEGRDLESAAKERGSDEIFERVSLTLLRRQNTLRLLGAARRQGLVDSVIYVLLLISLLGVAYSWIMHFQPHLVGMDDWRPVDLAWLDGWVGRLASAAIFGLVTTVGVLMTTIRRVLSEEDGVYMTFHWSRPQR